MCVWDLNRKAPAGASSSDPPPESARARSTPPPELLFQHAGHRAGVNAPSFHNLSLKQGCPEGLHRFITALWS